MEKTFLMVKPDGVQRHLIGKIVSRFEKKGFQLVAAKMMTISKTMAETHYEEHRSRPFFHDLVAFITSGPVFTMVWQGEGVIASARKMMGVTDPLKADPGTIRGDYGVHVNQNLIHGSDSAESASREISLFFKREELHSYEKTVDQWV